MTKNDNSLNGVTNCVLSFSCFCVVGFFSSVANACTAFLRHKMTIISPSILKEKNIPINKVNFTKHCHVMLVFLYLLSYYTACSVLYGNEQIVDNSGRR